MVARPATPPSGLTLVRMQVSRSLTAGSRASRVVEVGGSRQWQNQRQGKVDYDASLLFSLRDKSRAETTGNRDGDVDGDTRGLGQVTVLIVSAGHRHRTQPIISRRLLLLWQSISLPYTRYGIRTAFPLALSTYLTSPCGQDQVSHSERLAARRPRGADRSIGMGKT